MSTVPFPRFSIEEMDEPAAKPQPTPAPDPRRDPALGALMLGLKALSQGSVIAAARLTNLAMVISVFWLFMSIPDPSQAQIIWGGIYAVFILVLAVVINRGRQL